LFDEILEVGGIDSRETDEDGGIADVVGREEEDVRLGLHEEALFVVLDGLEDHVVVVIIAEASHEFLADVEAGRAV
jgi:hypothetical protein